ETRTARQVEFAGPVVEETRDSPTVLRGSGSAGVTWTAWHDGSDGTWLYASYSERYKPAATDVAIHSERQIPEPGTPAGNPGRAVGLGLPAGSLGWAGFGYARERGWGGVMEVNDVGSRFLNKRNTALAPAYTTWSAGVGYRADVWELRLDGANLNDRRPPVS